MMINEFADRREIENIYNKAKKSIKEQIEHKGVSCKGSAKGQAISEIMAVLDKELALCVATEMITARKTIREYYDKYRDIEQLKREYAETEEKIKNQKAVADMVSLLTDETLKNAIIAYNAIDGKGRYGNKEDAKAIAIAYIKSKGREDLKDTFEMSEQEKWKRGKE